MATISIVERYAVQLDDDEAYPVQLDGREWVIVANLVQEARRVTTDVPNVKIALLHNKILDQLTGHGHMESAGYTLSEDDERV